MKKVSFLLAVIATVLFAMPAFAELRMVHRASQIGGTGMMFQRIGDQLDPQEMNASIFVEYMQFDKIPLNPTRISSEPFIDDPRGDDEIWTTLTYNYGISHIVEIGIKIPFVFNTSTDYEYVVRTAPSSGLPATIKGRQDVIRENGIGRIGVDIRFLILNVDRMGSGISATLWMDAPSFQKENSSDQLNGGGELNITVKGTSFTNYLGSEGFDRYFLEPMSLHATMGFGWDDYLKFEEFDPRPLFLAKGYRYRNPDDPELMVAQVMYGSFGVDFEVYDNTFVSSELLFRQYPDTGWPGDRFNDNNTILILPEISYTYKDRFTVQAAFGFTGIENQNKEDDQPVWLGKIGFTYHFPEFYHAPQVERATPAHPQDLYELFVPSRKPIPTQIQEPEVPLPEENNQ